jgi:drug/metabolite transporter (DMT)-like permease
LLGILLALTSAAVWGAGDLGGGLAARRNHQFQVVALSAASGIVVLLVCWAARAEPMPPPIGVLWAVLAGLSGVFGIAALYRGLSLGNSALVAPTAGVVGALLPVIVNIAQEGWPDASQVAGFAAAIAGIWLVAKSSRATAGSLAGLRIAIVAGLGLGGFLVLIAQVPGTMVFGPLAVARVVGLVVSVIVLAGQRLTVPAPWSNPMALGAGVLDAGGTVFYVFAKQYTRLDIAAVLSSLYPVSTVLLARLLLKEHVTFAQSVGVALCLAAVVLITR